MKEGEVTILILAAGGATRMGGIKQLLPWKGTTLLGQAIKSSCSVSKDVWVVLGAHAQKIRDGLDIKKSVRVVEHRNWSKGLGSSLAFGLGELLKSGHGHNGLMVTLADQPLIDGTFLESMQQCFKKTGMGIVATAYGDQAGVPAIFDKKYYTDLLELTDDQGAKKLIQRNEGDVFVVPSEGRTIDLDTPDDYEKMKTENSRPIK